MKIAFIPPSGKNDYLATTVLDGLLWLKREGLNVSVALPDYEYPCPYDVSAFKMGAEDFVTFAQQADLIILCWGKGATNFELAEKIGCWEQTVFVDGSEVGKDRRYDPAIRASLANMTYEGGGAIDTAMLAKCRAYFRRERPYVEGIIPLPFGIESRYLPADPFSERAIDVTCIFGQEDFPVLRREVRESLEKMAKKLGLNVSTKKTRGFSFDDSNKLAGRSEFYKTLANSKAGVSIGGGGYDTARFWEILGNNCLLLTETIDIFEEGSQALDYKRIWQFKDLASFEEQLLQLTEYIKTDFESDYRSADYKAEYEKILAEHSTKARAQTILKSVNLL